MVLKTISYCLLAVGKFLGEDEVNNRLEFTYQLDNGKAVNAGSDSPIFQIEVPVKEGGGKVSVKIL